MPEHVETERKYDVPTEVPALTLEEPYALGPSRTHRLRATYLDTLDLALVAAGYSLRRREGGDDEGWHLKHPRQGDSRREVHAPLSSGSLARVPEELRAQVADVVGLDALVPVARLDTTRHERDVLCDGRAVASLADDEVRAASGGGVVAWREVEVELTAGTDADLDAVGTRLETLGLRRSGSGSKVGRVLGSAPRRRGRPRAGEVVIAYLARQVGTLQGLEAAVRSDEPDAVHKARVATRRIRSTLRVYRRLFHRDETDPLRDEVRWLGDALGVPRDAEVQRARLLEGLDVLERLRPELVVGPVRDRLDATLAAEHAAGHAALVDCLDSQRYARLLEALVELLVEPPLRGRARRRAKKVLPELAERAARRARRARRAADQAPDPAARAALLHEVRKKAKAARYAWDALVPVLGPAAAGASSRWEHVTDALGEYQDSRVAVDRLEAVATEAEDAGEPTLTYGVLAGREIEQGEATAGSAADDLDVALDG